VLQALLGEVCPKANKTGKTTVHKHQLIGANDVKKHKSLQYVKERLSNLIKNQQIAR